MQAPPGFGLKPKQSGTPVSTGISAMGSVEDASEEILHKPPGPPVVGKPGSRPTTPPPVPQERGDHGPRAGRRKDQGRGEEVLKQAAKMPIGPDGSKGFKYGRGKPMPRLVVPSGNIIGAVHVDTDMLTLREEVAEAKSEIGRLQQELFAAKSEAQQFKLQVEGGDDGPHASESEQMAADALEAQKVELSDARDEIRLLEAKLEGAIATSEGFKKHIETIEAQNAVLEASLSATRGAALKASEVEGLHPSDSEAHGGVEQKSVPPVASGSSAYNSVAGERPTGLAAVLADLGFKNPEQVASPEWHKHPTELQIRCQEAEGVANMLMRELQEARAQTAAVSQRLDAVMQQRAGAGGQPPNMRHGPPQWHHSKGPMMPQMYRGQMPPLQVWGPPPARPGQFSHFVEPHHDRPTAPPLPPGVQHEYAAPGGMHVSNFPPPPPDQWHETGVESAGGYVDQAQGLRPHRDGGRGGNQGGPTPPYGPPAPPHNMDVSMQQGRGSLGGPQRFMRPMGGQELGVSSQNLQQGPESRGMRAEVESNPPGGEHDLASLIRNLQQRNADSGPQGERHMGVVGTNRTNSTLIPSSVIMSTRGRDHLVQPTESPASPLKQKNPEAFTKVGGVAGDGDDEAWADEVIMHRGYE